MHYQRLVLLSFFIELWTLKSLSRYTLDTDHTIHPLPLDICLQITNDYVIYSCDTSSNPNILIKTNHTNNTQCASSNPIISFQSYNDSAPSFNCIGDDSYIILQQFDNENDCSYLNNNNNHVTSYIVTNICHNNIQYSCNEYYGYYSLQCEESSSTDTIYYISSTTCNNDRYVMTECVENDISIHNNSMDIDEIALFDIYFSLNNYGHNISHCLLDFTENTTDILCGLEVDEEYHITSIILENIYLFHGLPSTLCNLKKLSVISIIYDDIDDMNVSWSFPECIASDLPLLNELTLINTKINASIGSILMNNSDVFQKLYLENNPYIGGNLPSYLCNLTMFHIVNMTSIDGIIPECILSENSGADSYFQIVSTPLSGNIPQSICNTEYLYFRLDNNPLITGTIPQCTETKLYEFILVDMNGLNGYIPDWVFCQQTDLEWMDIRNTKNLDTQTMPLCFSETKPFLKTLIISKTSFDGLLPALPFSYELSILNIAHNTFEGDVRDLFMNYMDITSITNDLWCILMNDNNFGSNDDGLADMLEFIWSEWSVELFSIANNVNISGSIPSIQTKSNMESTFHSEYGVFMAHNCDINGVIPSDLIMPHHLQWFTLFDNRLSGSIPESIGVMNTSLLTPLILSGNILYSLDSNGLPFWMNNSVFYTASNLYSVTFQQYISILLVLISIFGIFVTIFSQIKHYRNKEELDVHIFFRKIEFIHWKFGGFGMLFWIIFLLVFYPLNAKYYEFIKLESLFTLNWYYHDNKWIDLILCVASIGFQYMVLNIMIKILTDTNDVNDKEEIEVIFTKRKTNKCIALIIFIIHLIIYISGIIVICIYPVIVSLPQDNILYLNEMTLNIISRSMALFLMLFNKYCISNLVDSFVVLMEYEDHYRFHEQSIIIIHILNCVIIPFVSAVILLQNCGRFWVKFWDFCIDSSLKERFDVTTQIMNDGYYIEFDVLSSNDLCLTQDLFNINWNKCIRSFCYNWSKIILYKVLFDIIGSIFGLFWRLIKLKMCPCFKQNRKWRLNIAEYNIKLMTNLIISLTYSFESPLIVPIWLMGVILIKNLHKVMMRRYDMTLYTSCNQYYLPLYLIVFGVLFNQFTVFLFLSFCVYSLFPATMFFAASIIMDLAVIKNLTIYNKQKGQSINNINDSIKVSSSPKNTKNKKNTKKITAKQMLNISRKKLSVVDENEEKQYDNNKGTEYEDMKQEIETDNEMKSYQIWVKEMREKMKSAGSNSQNSVIYERSEMQQNTNNNMLYHQNQISASEEQHYTIEFCNINPDS